MWHGTENKADRCYQDSVDLCAVRNRARVGSGLGLGTRELFIADCRQEIPGDRLPVAGRRYRTLCNTPLLYLYCNCSVSMLHLLLLLPLLFFVIDKHLFAIKWRPTGLTVNEAYLHYSYKYKSVCSVHISITII